VTLLCVLPAAVAVSVAAIPAAAAPLPCHQPQLASAGEAVYLTCGEANTIYVSSSQDGGRTFAPLTTVVKVPAMALGMHRGPRIAVAGDALVVTAVAGEKGGGNDGNLLAWRSEDHGRTWKGPVIVNDKRGSPREGLHAIASHGSIVVAAWLDLRATGTRLYAALSSDAGATWGRNMLVYKSPSGTICQCCHPSLAIAPDGTILAMFRNALDGKRDFYLARAKAGPFGPAQKLGTGSWTLDACPMDGGGIVVDADGHVTTVWRREQTVYLAQPDSPEIKVGDGVNPAVASTPDGPVVAWNAADGLVAASPHHDLLVLDRTGKFAALVPTSNGVVVAWETADGTKTKVLDK
jgi:hypothetical protein